MKVHGHGKGLVPAFGDNTKFLSVIMSRLKPTIGNASGTCFINVY